MLKSNIIDVTENNEDSEPVKLETPGNKSILDSLILDQLPNNDPKPKVDIPPIKGLKVTKDQKSKGNVRKSVDST